MAQLWMRSRYKFIHFSSLSLANKDLIEFAADKYLEKTTLHRSYETCQMFQWYSLKCMSFKRRKNWSIDCGHQSINYYYFLHCRPTNFQYDKFSRRQTTFEYGIRNWYLIPISWYQEITVDLLQPFETMMSIIFVSRNVFLISKIRYLVMVKTEIKYQFRMPYFWRRSIGLFVCRSAMMRKKFIKNAYTLF